MRLMRLLTASVGPLVARARCQATRWYPTSQRPIEGTEPRWVLGVLQVGGEAGDELVGQVRNGDCVDAADDPLWHAKCL